MEHHQYNRIKFPHFLTNQGGWDIHYDNRGHCAALAAATAGPRSRQATYLGELQYVLACDDAVAPQQTTQQAQAAVAAFQAEQGLAYGKGFRASQYRLEFTLPATQDHPARLVTWQDDKQELPGIWLGRDAHAGPNAPARRYERLADALVAEHQLALAA